MNIIIAGLTGAGKSTHCHALAQLLSLTLISGSDIRREFTQQPIIGNKREHWLLSNEAIRLDEERINDTAIDIAVNNYLYERATYESHLIFDVWFLPWLKPNNSLKIWIDCPLDIRVERILRAIGKVHPDMIVSKDYRAQQFAIAAYGIDIFSDREPFDVILSIDNPDTSICAVNTLLQVIAEKYLGVTTWKTLEDSTVISQSISMIARCPDSLYPTRN